MDECSSCASAEIELHNLRSAVASLHEKLYGIEIDHANAKNDYEEVYIHQITKSSFK